MKSIPPIKALMTPFPYSIDSAASVEEANRQMAEHGIRHLPVKRRGGLAGVVSDREVRLALETGRGAVSGPLTVGAVLAEAYVVDVNEPLDNVLLAMAERHLDAALVTKEDRLAGIFTVTDACRAFGRHLRDWFPRPGGDEAA